MSHRECCNQLWKWLHISQCCMHSKLRWKSRNCWTFTFRHVKTLSSIHTPCTTRLVGFCQNFSSVKNVCASVHVILESVRTIVLAIPTVIMDVHVLMKGKGFTCLCVNKLCNIGYLGSIKSNEMDGYARLKWILWSLRVAFWRWTRSMSENQHAGKSRNFTMA